MKKLILLAMLSIALYSCAAPVYHIGMSQEEFLRHNNATPIKETEQISIYRKRVVPGFGQVAVMKFFYFANGKLVQVDEGERAPDYNLKISN